VAILLANPLFAQSAQEARREGGLKDDSKVSQPEVAQGNAVLKGEKQSNRQIVFSGVAHMFCSVSFASTSMLSMPVTAALRFFCLAGTGADCSGALVERTMLCG